MGDRKARLAALAAKAGRTKPIPVEAPADNDQPEEETKKPISFRNYAPADDALDKDKKTEPETKRQRVDETKQSSSALESALQEAQNDIAKGSHSEQQGFDSTGIEVDSIAPKKINWDLKRDIEDKLAKLERRTQRAIVEMLKERLETEAAEQATSDASDLD